MSNSTALPPKRVGILIGDMILDACDEFELFPFWVDSCGFIDKLLSIWIDEPEVYTALQNWAERRNRGETDKN